MLLGLTSPISFLVPHQPHWVISSKVLMVLKRAPWHQSPSQHAESPAESACPGPGPTAHQPLIALPAPSTTHKARRPPDRHSHRALPAMCSHLASATQCGHNHLGIAAQSAICLYRDTPSTGLTGTCPGQRKEQLASHARGGSGLHTHLTGAQGPGLRAQLGLRMADPGLKGQPQAP